MALTSDDLFRLEAKARLHADQLRKLVAAAPGTSPGLTALDDARVDEAKAFDAIGDLLLGLQGDWDGMAPLVRDGFKRMSRTYDLSQTYKLAVIEPVADEAAA